MKDYSLQEIKYKINYLGFYVPEWDIFESFITTWFSVYNATDQTMIYYKLKIHWECIFV